MEGPEQFPTAESEDAGATKTKSARQACDLCKRMKIKCDWQGDSCKHCLERRIVCTATPIPRKKRMMKRTDYLAALEARIQQMEAAINAANLSAKLDLRESIVDQIGGQSELSDRMSTLMIGEEGNSQFIGASSGFSLFSPLGLQWIRERIGAYDAEQLIKAAAQGNKTQSDFSNLIWKSRPDAEQQPLPSKEVADQYVETYFQIFNPVFPLYEETSFRVLYERQYSVSPPAGVAWYASLNAVLAMGSAISQGRLKTGTPTSFLEPDSVCGNYGEIMAIQAILCMILMSQLISDPQPSYTLAAIAVRLSHAIGLHRSLGEFGLTPGEVKERRNIFWISYIIDVGVSLRTGRPPAMSDQNIAVALPRTTSEGYDQFRFMATLALLESRVHSELYSAEAGRRSGLEQLKRIGILDTELTQWRDGLPEGYRPESKISCPEHLIIPVTMLHFAYYNCLTAIHRASIHHGSWTSEPNDEASPKDHDEGRLNPRVYASSSLCLGAARNVIGQLKYLNSAFPRNGLIWMAVYYPVSAALVLFSNVLHSPQSPDAFSDIELMGSVIEFLTQSMELSKHLEATARIFAEMHRIAGRLVRDTQMAGLTNLKRQYEATAEPNGQSLPFSSGMPSTNQSSSPNAANDLSPSLSSYLYNGSLPFDQSQDLSAVDNSSFQILDSQYHWANLWTEPAPEDSFADGQIWYV